jgi:hypothetical protein
MIGENHDKGNIIWQLHLKFCQNPNAKAMLKFKKSKRSEFWGK